MARLFLIRHGEPAAAWGGADHDPGLSEAGRRQAAAAAGRLMSLGPLAIVSSPMRRCRETASPYETAAGRAARVDPRVSEVRTPPGVADRRAWLLENFPWRGGAPARAWSDTDPALRAWREEVVAAAREIDADTAVFSHFIAINAIVGAAVSADTTLVWRPGYASVTELDVSPAGLRLVQRGEEMQTGEVR